MSAPLRVTFCSLRPHGCLPKPIDARPALGHETSALFSSSIRTISRTQPRGILPKAQRKGARVGRSPSTSCGCICNDVAPRFAGGLVQSHRDLQRYRQPDQIRVRQDPGLLRRRRVVVPPATDRPTPPGAAPSKLGRRPALCLRVRGACPGCGRRR